MLRSDQELWQFLLRKKCDNSHIIIIKHSCKAHFQRLTTLLYALHTHARTWQEDPSQGRSRNPCWEHYRSSWSRQIGGGHWVYSSQFRTPAKRNHDYEMLLSNRQRPQATQHPTNQGLLVVEDFNEHSPSWGYQNINNRGEHVEDWMMDNNLVLINKPDDKPTCLSKAWKTTISPDLALATDDIQKCCQRIGPTWR